MSELKKIPSHFPASQVALNGVYPQYISSRADERKTLHRLLIDNSHRDTVACKARKEPLFDSWQGGRKDHKADYHTLPPDSVMEVRHVDVF